MAIITKKRESAGQYKVLQNGHTVAYIVKDKGVESFIKDGYTDTVTKQGWHIMERGQDEKWLNGNEILPHGFSTLKEAFNECQNIYSVKS